MKEKILEKNDVEALVKLLKGEEINLQQYLLGNNLLVDDESEIALEELNIQDPHLYDDLENIKDVDLSGDYDY